MTVQELITLLSELPLNAEIRIGDQIEAGPYLHQSPGGVWIDPSLEGATRVILCADDDNLWTDESDPKGGVFSTKLKTIWLPDHATEGAKEEAGLD